MSSIRINLSLALIGYDAIVAIATAARVALSARSSNPRRALCSGWCDDSGVIDEADTAQARELLQSLHAQVDEISKKVESAEGRTRRVQGHAAVVARRRVASLRHELYEAHRLIDGLHRRFPDARPRRVTGPRTEYSR